MSDPVWNRIDEELSSRRTHRLFPGSWADLARVLETSEQRLNNWKRRGVPAAQYAPVAGALGWSVDQLIIGTEAPNDGTAQAATHAVSDSDWELLQDMNDAMTVPEYASVIKTIRSAVSTLRDRVLARARERVRMVQDAGGGRVGGMSALGDLGPEAPPAPKAQKGKNKRSS